MVDIIHYLESLFVPFSADSFNKNHFNIYIDNLKKDFDALIWPFIHFYESFEEVEGVGDLFEVLIFSVFALLYAAVFIAIALIDIALQATTLALSLVTRSIATLGYYDQICDK